MKAHSLKNCGSAEKIKESPSRKCIQVLGRGANDSDGDLTSHQRVAATGNLFSFFTGNQFDFFAGLIGDAVI